MPRSTRSMVVPQANQRALAEGHTGLSTAADHRGLTLSAFRRRRTTGRMSVAYSMTLPSASGRRKRCKKAKRPFARWLSRSRRWSGCAARWLERLFQSEWVDYTGLTLEESYGRGWNTPFHPDDKQPAWEAWNHAVETGDTYSIECRLRRVTAPTAGFSPGECLCAMPQATSSNGSEPAPISTT